MATDAIFSAISFLVKKHIDLPAVRINDPFQHYLMISFRNYKNKRVISSVAPERCEKSKNLGTVTVSRSVQRAIRRNDDGWATSAIQVGQTDIGNEYFLPLFQGYPLSIT